VTDVLSKSQRSFNMSRIKGKDTQPELLVRSLVSRKGLRYRLHVSKLPGRPDLVFGSKKKVIEVYGCFWHKHNCKHGRVVPATNARFWKEKRSQTSIRDRRNRLALRREGWKVLIVWECWCRDPEKLQKRLDRFLQEA
jgi:DNA mismatch endonuclease (patch repair protein)